MKKHILYIFLLSLAFTSCEDDDSSSVAIQSYSPATITMSLSDNDVTISEDALSDDGAVYTVTATLAEAQTLDYVINFEQAGGTANADDFATHNIIIRAGATSGSSEITVLKTGDLEGEETLSIKATTYETTATLAGDIVFNATITDDYVDDGLNFSTTWSGSYSFTDGSVESTLDFCDVDLDFVLYELATGSYYDLGGTGSCTETGSMEGLPDGDYYILAVVYGNPFAAIGQTEVLPLTVSYSLEHFEYSGSFTSSAINLATAADEVIAIGTVTKTGYDYTVAPL
jgi:hypothetical protein